jgi:hypothetical protein
MSWWHKQSQMSLMELLTLREAALTLREAALTLLEAVLTLLGAVLTLLQEVLTWKWALTILGQ